MDFHLILKKISNIFNAFGLIFDKVFKKLVVIIKGYMGFGSLLKTFTIYS